LRSFAFWLDRSLLLSIARPLAWACVVAIAVLSLVPGDNRPHTGLPGWGEHFIAYAGTGFLFALGYRGLHQRILALIGLAIASGAFEILQSFVPGRSASALDALASTCGAAFGLLLGAILSAIV
jgi:VanZ family protein